jgi:hypothetical protein
MKIETHQGNNTKIAEIVFEGLLIKDTQDGLDLLGNLYYQGFDKVVLHEKNLTPDFFDLKNGIAGEILQKYSNYSVQLAIIGDFSKYTKKSIRDFIMESNKHGHVNFVSSIFEAKEKLARS